MAWAYIIYIEKKTGQKRAVKIYAGCHIQKIHNNVKNCHIRVQFAH